MADTYDQFTIHGTSMVMSRVAVDGAPMPTDADLDPPPDDFGPKPASKASDAKPLREPPDLVAICATLPGKYRRIPTYCDPLDAVTRGGLQTGRIFVVGGPPGVTKTGWTLAMAYEMAKRGVDTPEGHRPVVVAIAATDEPRDGLLSRIGQMEGAQRASLESEELHLSRAAWTFLGDRISQVPNLMIFDPRCEGEAQTVDEMMEIAVARATKIDARLVIIIDSIQTAPFASDLTDGTREPSTREKIEARMRTVRRWTVRHGACAIVVSELNRGAYRQGAEADLASFKEAGGIEYGADIAVTMKRLKDEDGVIEVTVQKNRLGELEPFRLKRDDHCQFDPVAMPEGKSESGESRDHDDVEKLARDMERALVTAKGDVKSRPDLYALVKGKGQKKVKAASLLITTGRIEGGSGKPFRVVSPQSEESE